MQRQGGLGVQDDTTKCFHFLAKWLAMHAEHPVAREQTLEKLREGWREAGRREQGTTRRGEWTSLETCQMGSAS